MESGGGSEKTSSEKRRSAGDRCATEEGKHHGGTSREEEGGGFGESHQMGERERDDGIGKLFSFGQIEFASKRWNQRKRPGSGPVRVEIPVIGTVY